MTRSRPRLAFVTYADGAFERNIPPILDAARRFMGVDRTFAFTRKDLEADPVYAPHRDVFDAPRGRGYWAWKPWAILKAFDACEPGDVLIYHDCGFGPRYRAFLRPTRLVELAIGHDFIAGVVRPDHGPNSRWIHRRCLEIVGAASPACWDAEIVEAVVSVWVVGDRSRAFLESWLRYCLDFEAIRDIRPEERADQRPDFVEHRYDQAVLTALAIREGAFVITPSAAAMPFAKSLSMLELDQRARRSTAARLALTMLSAALKLFWRVRGVRPAGPAKPAPSA